MREAKAGESIEVDGVEYFIGENHARAINVCRRALNKSPAGIKSDEIEVHLFSQDGKISSFLPFAKIEKALTENIER